MSAPKSRIAPLDALHRRYDGPVPKAELARILAGQNGFPESHDVAANLGFWRSYIRGAIRAGRLTDSASHRRRIAADIGRAWPYYRRTVRSLTRDRHHKHALEAQRRLWDQLWRI